MIDNIALGALLTFFTMALHGLSTAGLIAFLRTTHAEHWALRSTWAFTTLGYGDVTVSEPWRLLASLEAAVGTIAFGWTTALIVGASHRLYFGRRDA